MKGVATHHDPDSSIEIILSDDNGESWSDAYTIYNSNYGVNDPAITVCNDDSILVRFVALEINETSKYIDKNKKIFSHRTEHGLVTNVVGNIILKSTDMCKTWSYIGQDKVDEIGPSCSRDPIVEMPDGSLLMTVYTGAPQRSDEAWLLRSFDKGKNWGVPTKIASDIKGKDSQLQGVNYNESSLLNLNNGHLIALIRGDQSFHTSNTEFMPVGGVGQLYLTHSFDSGMSWTNPIDTEIFGQPGSLIKLSSGNVLATYGYRKKPFGVRCKILNCKNWKWGKEFIIRDDCETWDCGYPFSLELNENVIFTVYYFTDTSGLRHIQSTKWKINL